MWEHITHALSISVASEGNTFTVFYFPLISKCFAKYLRMQLQSLATDAFSKTWIFTDMNFSKQCQKVFLRLVSYLVVSIISQILFFVSYFPFPSYLFPNGQLKKIADVSALGDITEKPVSQNSIKLQFVICWILLMLVENLKLFLKEMNSIQMLQIETHRRLISICSARKIKQTNWFSDLWKYE